MIAALILIPGIAGLLAFLLRSNEHRRLLLVSAAALHTALTAAAWKMDMSATPDSWWVLDPMGHLFLSVTSVLFLAAAVYTIGYLRRERSRQQRDFQEGFAFVNEPEAVLIGCLLLFLMTMTLIAVSHHLGMLWLSVEASTLASAPLIFYHRHHRSLEAAWKYLLICSVGIALALLGNYFLALSAMNPGGQQSPLLLGVLTREASGLNTAWLKTAFLFFFVGYGTKMGLAPLHTWLPDAHSESPSMVSALLSGALLNCAFLGILRAAQVCAAAGLVSFVQELFLLFGILSMAVAAVFIIGQTDYKRLLAYSSVEHMGILALGIGVGGMGVFGSMLHLVNHSLTKGMLFLVAGNILAYYQTKKASDVRGILRILPVTGILWTAGLFAISGSPPFGVFLSELTILKAAF